MVKTCQTDKDVYGKFHRSVFFILLLSTGCNDPWFGDKPTTVNGLKLEFYSYGRAIGAIINEIHFVNEQTGYFTGGKGICKTENGGKNWKYLNLSTGAPIKDIYFITEQEGFVVAGGSYCPSGSSSTCTSISSNILHTSDGGQTWTHTQMPNALGSIWFNNATSGFAVGPSTIFSTIDRGASWQVVTLDIPLEGLWLKKVQFINEQKGIITTSTGKFLTTADGGKSWNMVESFFKNSGTLSLVREDLIFFSTAKKVYRSYDFGNTWSELTGTPTSSYNLDFIFVSEDVGYAYGGVESGSHYEEDGCLYYTIDGGVTWTGTCEIHETSSIRSIHFPTPTTGYVGSGSMLVKITRKK